MPETNVDVIDIFPDDGGGWRWRGKSANGEIVATSESYTRHEDARRAAEATFPGVNNIVEIDSEEIPD